MVVPLAVDQACACALQLMTHAARAPDVDVDVLVVALDRLADRLAQVEAALATGHRVLHHIDRKRNHRARPSVLDRVQLAAHQRQRHREAMVHVHLVDDGQVKVLLNDRLRNVRSQLGVTFNHRHRAWAPAFVGRLVLGSGADGKGGNQVRAESRGMVVEHQKNHVWFVVLHPLSREVIAREHGFPIVFLCLAQIHGRANGGHMRGVDGGGDFGHVLLSRI